MVVDVVVAFIVGGVFVYVALCRYCCWAVDAAIGGIAVVVVDASLLMFCSVACACAWDCAAPWLSCVVLLAWVLESACSIS